jgi:hypothetical protein
MSNKEEINECLKDVNNAYKLVDAYQKRILIIAHEICKELNYNYYTSPYGMNSKTAPYDRKSEDFIILSDSNALLLQMALKVTFLRLTNL